jgi:hypothetical protein
MVRISIESARTGYLYVIDREKYGNGTYGEADVIFPTLRTRHGVNQVKPGEVIEIPSWDDLPRYFLVRKSRPDQVAEVLTMIVAPEPIEGLKIGSAPAKLGNQQLRLWEEKWGNGVERLETSSQIGKSYTKLEAEAGKGLAVLNSTDPVPQTMFHVKARADDPILVTVPLTISR